MFIQKIQKFKYYFISFLALMPLLTLAYTPTDYGLGAESATANTKLGQANIKDTIISIVNIVLGALGILSVVIIILGGFKWMTSQGNTEKVDEAKKLISSGIIGLVIIMTAFAIANFIVKSLINATTPTPLPSPAENAPVA